MRSITIFNNKGGVGKTTFLCNIAAFLALRRQKRVLIVDADPQCNATIYLLPEDRLLNLYDSNARGTIDSYLDPLRRGKGYVDTRLPLTTVTRFGVDLVPGDPRLALSEDLLASDWSDATAGKPRGLQTTFVFKDLLERYSEYDYIFIDVGPSLGALNRSVLIASDFFVMPMSSDIFSLMAIRNIANSLTRWKKDLAKGLDEYADAENEPYTIHNSPVEWTLQFAGYVTQQYTAKTVQGTRRPVRAYERVIRRAPKLIQQELVARFGIDDSDIDYKLGEIPNLHSIVPMSQTVNAPVFDLKAKDGVVGAHFAKVAEASEMYDAIARKLTDLTQRA